MARYRKRPIIIDAVQWHLHGDHPAVIRITSTVFNALPEWLKDDLLDLRDTGDGAQFGLIPTLEGGHLVQPGDWIITGVKGEVYPCKPDIFALTYEPVED